MLGDTPRRVRLLMAGLVVLATLLGLVYGLGLARDSTSFADLGAHTSELGATDDLYYRLNDMDAQAADALLVGYRPVDASIVPASVNAAASVSAYNLDRHDADADLAEIARNPLLTGAAGRALDDLGRYEADIAQALYIDQTSPTPQQPATPPAAALSAYVAASGLLHDALLPEASAITTRDAAAVDSSYSGDHGAMAGYGWIVGALALLLIAALVLGNAYYHRRFRRRLSTLIPAAAVALVLGVVGLGGQLAEAGHLHVAKQNAYDSIYALTQAKAISDGANADESRWLLESRDPALQTSFFTEMNEVGSVPGYAPATSDPDIYYTGLAAEVGRLSLDASADSVSRVTLGGYLGAELGNVTFPNEARDAYAAVTAFDAYAQNDRTIRQDAQDGDLAGAVAFDIGLGAGQSNYDFGRYTNALALVVGDNQGAFDAAVAQGRAGVGAAAWTTAALGWAVLVLLIAQSGRLRLREYR
ncbi:hypothetical protein KDL01_22680 [Actinospica durhamensis]|uniref:Uncharacterized protein n=1 Tax=Actinospica durhamensis TaxID=1508375 RepID=A0A941IP34_9ACTN|nr:hypothetical protein [Actinospica durhamensis]MBR7836100.1 hypothetical protein [Actinospica durhamensis]